MAYGYGSRSYGGNSYGSSGYSSGPIQAAIQSRRTIQYRDVPSTYSAAAPLNIAVPASVSPVNMRMYSRSSPINVQAYHESSPGSYQETSSVDAPHVRKHTVTRPIIQQVNEVIQPYRQIRQQVNPVQEQVEQNVARGYAAPSYSAGSSYGRRSSYNAGY